jgi:hypothetical protein
MLNFTFLPSDISDYSRNNFQNLIYKSFDRLNGLNVSFCRVFTEFRVDGISNTVVTSVYSVCYAELPKFRGIIRNSVSQIGCQ